MHNLCSTTHFVLFFQALRSHVILVYFRSLNSEDQSLGLVNFSSQYDSKICPRECVTKTEKMSNISKRKNITDDPIIILKWESYRKISKKDCSWRRMVLETEKKESKETRFGRWWCWNKSYFINGPSISQLWWWLGTGLNRVPWTGFCPNFFRTVCGLWFINSIPFWRKILYWFILLVIGKIFFIKMKCYPWWNSFPNFEFEFIWHKWPLMKCLLQILTKFNSTTADWQKKIFVLMNSVQMSVWRIYVDHLKCRKTFLIGWTEGYPKSTSKNGGEFLSRLW